MPDSRLEILLVEDDQADVRLVREALTAQRSSSSLAVVNCGAEALAYLRRQAPFEAATRPGLVLLDLNLPGINGTEVLREIKGDPTIAGIPILVLTVSSSEDDLCICRSLGADGYARKPLDVRPFFQLIRTIEQICSEPCPTKREFHVFDAPSRSPD